MTRFWPSLFFCALALLVMPGQADGRSRLASLDLADPDTSYTVTEIRILSDAIRSAIRASLPTGRYIIMTRENIFELLPPDISLTDCLDDACAVETGRKIGADHLITAEAARLGNELRTTLNLYDTASANLLNSKTARGQDILELEAALSEAATDLVLLLPHATRDYRGAELAVAARHRQLQARHSRINRILVMGGIATTAAGGYFHFAADGAYNDHLEATDAATAARTWDDYRQNTTLRNVSLGIAAGMIVWRLVRAFDAPSVEDARRDITIRHSRTMTPDLTGPIGHVLWTYEVRF